MKFSLWEAVVGLAIGGTGIAIAIDTGVEGSLQIPNWVWYVLAGTLILSGFGIAFGVVSLKKA